jgi:hypothetical protein
VLTEALMERTSIDKTGVIARLHENVERAMQAVPVMIEVEGEWVGRIYLRWQQGQPRARAARQRDRHVCRQERPKGRRPGQHDARSAQSFGTSTASVSLRRPRR